jgi:outer membrane immunogenic protein
MTRLKFYAAVLAASACYAGTAVAADVYDGSMKDAPMPAPVETWTGFFIGGGGGLGVVNYGGGTAGAFDAPGGAAALDAFAFPLDNDQGNFFGTVQLGYDRELPSRFVFGIFGDYDFNDDSGTAFDGITALPLGGTLGDTLSFAGTAEVDNSWTIGGRLGFLATPGTLIYGLVGWTHADLTVNGAFTFAPAGVPGAPLTFSAEEDIDAVTVGAGVETMLGRGLTLKFEYRYTDLDGLSVVSDLTAIGGGAGSTATTSVDSDLHTVRAVLTWRPNWW